MSVEGFLNFQPSTLNKLKEVLYVKNNHDR